jgi:hypothetical protein
MDYLPQRSKEALLRQATTTRKGRTRPANLREQVDTETVKMWPTPTVGCVEGGEQSSRVEKTKKGSYILRKKNKPENTFGAKLSDAVLFEEKQQMWPTPTNQEAGKGKFLETLTTKEGEKAKQGERAYNPKTGKHVQITLDRAAKMWPTPRASGQENPESLIKRKGARAAAQHNLTAAVQMMPTPVQDDVHYRKEKYKQGGTAPSTKVGGSLNPTWVEWLMGYQGGYTDLKHWEILSSRKSSKK